MTLRSVVDMFPLVFPLLLICSCVKNAENAEKNEKIVLEKTKKREKSVRKTKKMTKKNKKHPITFMGITSPRTSLLVAFSVSSESSFVKPMVRAKQSIAVVRFSTPEVLFVL